ncbi:DUF1292 domain-containing protein [Ureibacillus sp. GCM10028918]|uniref:DUF1292 domain-containing protein n=1 Tax=Ureibacillus sp. GCM10028918 TaxID=3273429 RepID=UPI003615D683
MDEQYFKIQLEDGTEQQCRAIMTFDSEEHSYVLYSIVDENGNDSEEVSALRFELDENGEMTDFTSLETEAEWEMVDEVLNTLIAEFGDGEEDFFTISDENDEDVVCEVIHRFELEEFNKSYILYTFADQEEVGEIFAACYIAGEKGEVQDLLPIETDEEWEKVEQELQSLNQK